MRRTIPVCLLVIGSLTGCGSEKDKPGPAGSVPSSEDSFQRAFDAGASCDALFRIRNDAGPAAPGRSRMDELLRSVGCHSASSERTAAGPAGGDVPAPPQPAVYKTVENALTKAGLSVCTFTGYGENQDFAYLESRHYYIAKGPCRSDRPHVEGNPRFGTVRVEIYLNEGTLERGVSAHKNELRYERPVSGAAWSLEKALVEVPHYVHPAMAQAVERAMRSIAAKRKYSRFR
jgi:hypothetical protein